MTPTTRTIIHPAEALASYTWGRGDGPGPRMMVWVAGQDPSPSGDTASHDDPSTGKPVAPSTESVVVLRAGPYFPPPRHLPAASSVKAALGHGAQSGAPVAPVPDSLSLGILRTWQLARGGAGACAALSRWVNQ